MTTVKDMGKLDFIREVVADFRPACQFVYHPGDMDRMRVCRDYPDNHPKNGHVGKRWNHEFQYDPDKDTRVYALLKWLIEFYDGRREVLR